MSRAGPGPDLGGSIAISCVEPADDTGCVRDAGDFLNFLNQDIPRSGGMRQVLALIDNPSASLASSGHPSALQLTLIRADKI